MTTIKDAPMPVVRSTRLLGLELEIDAGTAPYRAIATPTGWDAVFDGSLTRGSSSEYILKPPLPAVEALPAIEAFSAATKVARSHVCKKGGFHVHVQIHDYQLNHAHNLYRVYAHFQPSIDKLTGPSRRGTRRNQFCLPFDSASLPASELARMFQLNVSASSRSDAKGSRQKRVVNFAMMRCSNVLDRTVEFRQQSISTHAVNIFGWAAFVLMLTEFCVYAPQEVIDRYLRRRQSWPIFLAMCRTAEEITGVERVLDWVKWREQYLSAEPDAATVRQLYHVLNGRPKGLLTISRRLSLNHHATEILLTREAAAGRVDAEGGKYRAGQGNALEADYETILEKWTAQEATPLQVTDVERQTVTQQVA